MIDVKMDALFASNPHGPENGLGSFYMNTTCALNKTGWTCETKRDVQRLKKAVKDTNSQASLLDGGSLGSQGTNASRQHLPNGLVPVRLVCQPPQNVGHAVAVLLHLVNVHLRRIP